MRVCLFGVLLSLAVSSARAQTIDQSTPFGGTPFTLGGFGFPSGYFVQSFTPSFNNVAGAGAYVGVRPNNENDAFVSSIVQFSLFNVTPWSLGATAIRSASKTISAARPNTFSSPTFDGWVDVFWDPVAVAAGSTLYLKIEHLSAFPGSVNVGVNYSDGSAWQVLTVGGVRNLNEDMVFRTWVTPEPSTNLMVAAGLMLLIARARRRGLVSRPA